MPTELIIDLVRHMEAVNRAEWGEDDDARPLSTLGKRQAAMHADAMAGREPVVALYASPALRCRETIRPLAERLGLSVRIEPLLADTRLYALLPAGAENPLVCSLLRDHPGGGRVVACSHADTIPAFLQSLEPSSRSPVPATLKGFGGWYRVHLSGGECQIEHFEAPFGFPQDEST